MGFVMAGLLSGLGQGMVKDWEAKREEALAELAAERQFARDVRTQTHQTKIEDLRQDRMDARTNATIEATNQRTTATLQSRADIARENREAAAALARELKNLEGAQSAAEIRLAAELRRREVQGVQYGPPDESGTSELIIVNNDGTTRSSGTRVAIPESRDQKTGSGRPPVASPWPPVNQSPTPPTRPVQAKPAKPSSGGWRNHTGTARALLGSNATAAQIEAKAKELHQKYGD